MSKPKPAFDPELRTLARVLPRGLAGDRALRVIRPLERMMDRRPPPAGVTVERAGSVPVRVQRPAGVGDAPRPALLWLHGGGYILGKAAQDDKNCREICRRLGIVAAAVDYRTAPEHPFPAALDDAHDALVWLASQPDVDDKRIAIGGASAGGGLAASLALEARERAQVTPAFQLLVYPMLDDRTALRHDIDERGFRLWSNKSNRFGWKAYLGTEPGFPGITAPASPARADDLAGLPPAWIGVGTLDLFCDEDLAYAERLREAGVACEVEIAEGAFHGFDGVAPKAEVSRRFRRSHLRALGSALDAEPAVSQA